MLVDPPTLTASVDPRPGRSFPASGLFWTPRWRGRLKPSTFDAARTQRTGTVAACGGAWTGHGDLPYLYPPVAGALCWVCSADRQSRSEDLRESDDSI